tara:strand:- start:371 stop:742 length:372 start_codon:yes stop_codon:yes gene_type:complete
MYLNRLILIGNATKKPEVRQTNSGKNVANFTVATNEYWKSATGEQMSESEFHYITAWDRLADICGNIIHKGQKVYIEGRKRTTTFPRDGVEVERVEVVAHKVMTLEKAKTDNYEQEGDYDGNF